MKESPKQSNVGSKIVKNFSFLTIGKLLGDLFTFVFFVIISRKFGQEGVGSYSFAIAFTGFFVTFVDFGLYFLSTKELSRNFHVRNIYYGAVISLRLVLAILILTTLSIIVPFLSFPQETKFIIWIIGLFQILYILVDGVAAVFIANENAKAAALIEFFLRSSTAASAIILILVSDNLVISLITLPITTATIFILSLFWLLKSYGTPTFKLDKETIQIILKNALPYGIAEFLRQLSTRIDIVFLGFMLGSAAAGIYNAAYRIVFFFMFIVGYSSVTILPAATKLYNSSPDKFVNLIHTVINYVVLIGLPMAIGLWLIADQIILLIFGDSFEESIAILQILSFVLFATFLKSSLAIFLAAADKQSKSTKCQWIGAILNIIGNLILIPTMGIIGAAVATLISEVTTIILFSRYFIKDLNFTIIVTRFLYALAGCSAFVIPFLLLDNISIAIIIPSSAIIYCISLLAFNDIRKNEFSFVFNSIKNRIVENKK